MFSYIKTVAMCLSVYNDNILVLPACGGDRNVSFHGRPFDMSDIWRLKTLGAASKTKKPDSKHD